jgi:hypothetical protein
VSSKGKRMMRSGHIFSLSALNVFGVYIGERGCVFGTACASGHAHMRVWYHVINPCAMFSVPV